MDILQLTMGPKSQWQLGVLPIHKKLSMSIAKDGKGIVKTLHWIHLVSKFSPLAWEICPFPLHQCFSTCYNLWTSKAAV